MINKLFTNYRKITAGTFAVLFTLGLVMVIFLQNYSPANSGDNPSIIDQFFGNFLSKPENILLLGGDAVAGNTDTMMVININPTTNEISMLSIPRDTKVTVDSYTGKINSIYNAKGPEALMDTVGNMLNTKIKYYAWINLTVFKEVIDLLGGVDFDVPVDLYYHDKAQGLFIDLKKGQQHLDGDHAVQLMRYREWGGDSPHPTPPPDLIKFYNGGDLTRIDMQQKFIKEIIKQKLNFSNVTKLGDILNAVFHNLKTNLTADSVLNPAPKFLQGFNSENIHQFKLNGTDGPEYTGGPWYFYYGNTVFQTTNGENKIVDSQPVIDQYFQCDEWYAGAKENTTSSKGTKNTKAPSKTSGNSGKDTPSPGRNTPSPGDDRTDQPSGTVKPTSTIKPTVQPTPSSTPKPSAKPSVPPATSEPQDTQKPENGSSGG